MANAKEIQARMKSIQDTMKITNAMYMISSSKMKRAKQVLADTEPYFYNMQNAVSRILRHMPDVHTASNFDLLFKGGPYLAYGVGGKTKIDGVSEKADTFGDDGLKRFDAGLGLGVAFEFGKIVVGVETGTSFTKVASGASAYNLSALATIGYKF